jgi:ribonucleoside-diphosphate reductase alpha chain
MKDLRFLPNSPTLMNAGTALQQLAACFVIPVEDSIEGIFDALKWAAIVHQSGGGTGFSFSRLRPSGDVVASTSGQASGPLSFMKVFDVATEAVRQGGRRRGASMGVLRVDHPDILQFIHSKDDKKTMSNFNISVGITDEFISAVENDDTVVLRNPHGGAKAGEMKARRLLGEICDSAWRTGDPGVLFLDTIERTNPTPNIGTIESTNPCGEVPLLPFEACNLGSINLVKMYDDVSGGIDWDILGDTVSTAIRFLDNVIDASKYPLPQINEMVKGNRKVGLGVMGFADLLLLQNERYGSRESFDTASRLMGFMKDRAKEESASIGSSRGSFPNIDGSNVIGPMRNATLLSIAPTGTISMIAGCSSGIEPNFAFYMTRHVLDGEELVDINHVFLDRIKAEGLDVDLVLKELSEGRSLSDVPGIPDAMLEVFVTAHDIDPLLQVEMQSRFQEHVDNGVSKTINLPRSSTPDDVARVFMEAYNKGCKGITVYREGSKPGQVLTAVDGKVGCFMCGKI